MIQSESVTRCIGSCVSLPKCNECREDETPGRTEGWLSRPDYKDAGEEAYCGKSENTGHGIVIRQDDDPEFCCNRSEQGNQRED